MTSKAKVMGHPAHPLLVVFPLGLLVTSFLFDVIYIVTGDGVWATVSFYMIGAGIIGGICAAVPGIIDWLAIPGRTRAKQIGLFHALGNTGVLLLFTASWFARRAYPDAPPLSPIVVSFVGVGLAAVTGWLGSELVYRLGIGVDDGSNANAPSSLETPTVPRARGAG